VEGLLVEREVGFLDNLRPFVEIGADGFRKSSGVEPLGSTPSFFRACPYWMLSATVSSFFLPAR
jgi:hypothetical protein